MDIVLNNGNKMPYIGLGTWQGKPGEVETAVKAAIASGYRHIDCAFFYGNEAEIGRALEEVFKEGRVKREDMFIVSKLWNTFHEEKFVEPMLRESLKLLRLQYLDLYLVHWPMAFKSGDDLRPTDEHGNILYSNVSLTETWKGFEKCVDKGLVKNIGISNFNSQQTLEILKSARIKPVVNQIEIHPYFQQEKLVNFCHKHNLAVTAYFSFGSPMRPWIDKTEPLANVLEDETLKSIANKHKKSTAQIILRWLIQRNVSIVPKSSTPSRIAQNIQVFDFSLTTDDMQRIKSLDKNERANFPQHMSVGNIPNHHEKSPNYPFGIEF